MKALNNLVYIKWHVALLKYLTLIGIFSEYLVKLESLVCRLAEVAARQHKLLLVMVSVHLNLHSVFIQLHPASDVQTTLGLLVGEHWS